MIGKITEIQRSSFQDGPGIRSTIFFKGCNMRCIWCHNPETFVSDEQIRFIETKCINCGHCYKVCPTGALKYEDGIRTYDESICIKCYACIDACYPGALVISGKDMSVRDVIAQVMQDKPYYDNSGGGITITGGEPFMQRDFLMELVDACKANDLHVGIETNMSYEWAVMEPILKKIDLVMLDIKHMDDTIHKKYTGVTNRNVLENIRKLDKLGKPFIVRTPLIPNINDSKENLIAIAEFLSGFDNLQYYELLNYNPLAQSKFEQLSKPYLLSNAKHMPKKELSILKQNIEDAVPSIDLRVQEG